MSKKTQEQEENTEEKRLTINMMDKMLYQTYLHYKKRLDKGEITPGELTALNTFLKNNDTKISEIPEDDKQDMWEEFNKLESNAAKEAIKNSNISEEVEENLIGK